MTVSLDRATPAPQHQLPAGAVTLAYSDWNARSEAHAARVHELTAAHAARKSRRETHPIEDFLWTYYSFSPADLRRWQPGAGVILCDAAETRATWKFARVLSDNSSVMLDVDAYIARRGPTMAYVAQLLNATLAHTPNFGCFGLHEWAMVYHLTPEQVRHTRLPLRLGHEKSDQVVRDHRIQCTHFDAYRFFTPDAVAFNTLTPTRDSQAQFEQSACLHAGMDVYKWIAKLSPIMPGELLLDAFVLARDIRQVDMRASPYDVTGYTGANGEALTPIRIENAAGKREYAALQEAFAERGNALRVRTLAAINHAISCATVPLVAHSEGESRS